jgi:hypothetical protein
VLFSFIQCFNLIDLVSRCIVLLIFGLGFGVSMQ